MTSFAFVKADTSANIKIQWSYDTNFSDTKSVTFDTDSELNCSTSFNDEVPNYFKIINMSLDNSSIVSARLSFSCVENYHQLTLTPSDSSYGTASGSGVYRVGESISISASANTGYSFDGWYRGDSLISSDNPYTFNMSNSDLSYIAKFSITNYQVTLTSVGVGSSGKEGQGTVSGGGIKTYNSNVTIIATPEEGSEFIGWYNGDTLISSSAEYSFLMPLNNLSYTAKFVKKYHVTIEVFNSEYGTVSGEGDYGYSRSVTLTANAKEGYWFIAWYDSDYDKLSDELNYTFKMSESDSTFYAEFSAEKPVIKGDTYQFGSYPQSKVDDESLQATLTAAAGDLPTASDAKAWTDYGYYIENAVSSYMWYQDVTNDSIKYRGVYFTSYRPSWISNSSSSSYSKQDDNGYNTSNVYWFKFEPISWKVLDTTDTAGFLFANLNLDSQDYHYSSGNRIIGGETIYANNYKESHIRAWLNDNFYNTAFSASEQARILTTTVDNSVASTGYSSNQYVCGNTNDKVFLLSYTEATNANYGLNTNTARMLSQTDYASCQGISRSTSYTPNTSSWWFRSPYFYDSRVARDVGYNGSIYDGSSVYYTSFGVAPALWVSK